MSTTSTRGIGYTKHLDLTQTRGVYESPIQNWNFLYEVSTTRDPEFFVGDVVELPNGKGFVYCKSGAACYTGLGNILYNAIPATGIDYSLLAETAPAGQDWVKMTNQGTVAQTLDGLRGGTICLKLLTGSDDTALQCRGIVGNTAGGVSDVITIYLDAAVSADLSVLSYGYCMPSPYSDVRYSASVELAGQCSHVGFANTYVDAANKYHWEQFRGRRMGVSLQGDPGGDAAALHERELVWRYQGSLQSRYTTEVLGLRQQVAGYIMDNNTAENGATEVMLTGSV